jgi:hypothetical protein
MSRVLVLALALAPPALAQQTPEAVLNPETCGVYLAMDEAARIGFLTTIEPVGDDINAADQRTARQWAADVAEVCEGAPERLLSDAATEALGAE